MPQSSTAAAPTDAAPATPARASSGQIGVAINGIVEVLGPGGNSPSAASLGRMLGQPAPAGAPGVAPPSKLSPRSTLLGTGTANPTPANGSAGGGAASRLGAGSGPAPRSSRAGNRVGRGAAKGQAQGGTRLAAVDNIGDAMGKFFQESLELAPKPPPRTPSTSSDDGGPDGPWSSDDELAKEELDVLERLYLVMPHLESPGKGALALQQGPNAFSNTAPTPRFGAWGLGSGTGTGSRPTSAALSDRPSSPSRLRSASPTPGGKPTSTAAASPVAAAPPPSGSSSPPRRTSASAQAKAGRRGSASGLVQPVFVPSKAVLSFHHKALGLTLPLQGNVGATGVPTVPAVSGQLSARGAGPGGAAGSGVGGDGGPEQGQEGRLSSAYVDRGADFLMVQAMVKAAVGAGASRPATAAGSGAAAGRQLALRPLSPPPPLPPAAAAGKGAGSGKGAAAPAGKGSKGKKAEAEKGPAVLVPLPAVPVHLQHLLRPGSAAVGALMGGHVPAGLDPAILAAVKAGEAVDITAPVEAAGVAAAGGGVAGARSPSPGRPGSPQRTVSPVRPGTAEGRGGVRPSSGSMTGRTSNSGAAGAGGGRPVSGGGSRAASPLRPQSGGGGPAFGRTGTMGGYGYGDGRPATAPQPHGASPWAAARLQRLRGTTATRAVARATQSPLRASLAAPISGLQSPKVPRKLNDEEHEVLSRSLDSALFPITRAAAKLGTYGEKFPTAQLYSSLNPAAVPRSRPSTTTGTLAAASSGRTSTNELHLSSRPGTAVGAGAGAGGMPVPAPLEGTSAAAVGLPGGEDGPRRKLRRQDYGEWEWPPGRGSAARFDVLWQTGKQVAEALATSEALEATHTGPCDRVGEVGRMLRRFHKQANPTAFNLNHSINGVDQVTALVDVLAHPDLSLVSSLGLADNGLCDEWWGRGLGSRLGSPACASLRDLDLRGNALSGAAAVELAPLLKDELAMLNKAQRLRRGADVRPHAVLTRLLLCGNPLGDAGAELLCDAAASPYSALAELRMSRCGLGERGAAAAGRLLEHSSAIRILDLSWNTLGRRGAQSLGEGLRAANTVEELLLAWTGITDVGASHIAKALKASTTLRVLDLSGDAVSGDTSLVLLDSLGDPEAGACTSLRRLLLRDNPVGVVAARKLLKAVKAGQLAEVDLLGCSFGVLGASSTVAWDPHDPDGVYDLDLEVPAHYQVAIELLGLAATMGLRSWRSATHNGRPFRLLGSSKLAIPQRGRLHVEFASCVPALRREAGAPLSDEEVMAMWFELADPDEKYRPEGPMVVTAYDGQTIAPRPSSASSSLNAAPAGAPHPGPTRGRSMSRGAPSLSGAGPVGSTTRKSRPGSDAQPSARPTSATPGGPAAAAQRLAAPAGGGADAAAGGSSRRLTSVGSTTSNGRAAAAAAGGKGGKDAKGKKGGKAAADAALRSMTQLKGATDEWKLELLEALVTDVYLTCGQLKEMVRCFESREARGQAVVAAFGVLVDTENLYAVLEELDPGVREEVETRLGRMRLFYPQNPTGRYTLMLAQLTHACIAKQLLQQYCRQADAGLTQPPLHVCFTACTMDGLATDVSDPNKLYLPQEGILDLAFVDLRPVPPGSRALARPQFAVLLAHLANADKLDAVALIRIIDHPAIPTAIAALRRWTAWSARHPISACVPYLRSARHALDVAAAEAAADALESPFPTAAASTPSELSSPLRRLGTGIELGDGGGSGSLLLATRTGSPSGRFGAAARQVMMSSLRPVATPGGGGVGGGGGGGGDTPTGGGGGGGGGVTWDPNATGGGGLVSGLRSTGDGTSWSRDRDSMTGDGTGTGGGGSSKAAAEDPRAAYFGVVPLVVAPKRGVDALAAPTASSAAAAAATAAAAAAAPTAAPAAPPPVQLSSPLTAAASGSSSPRRPARSRPRTATTAPPLYVRDLGGYVEAVRMLAVRHHLTCWQLLQLLQLLPPHATDEVVETATAFWARVIDRESHWVDVMRFMTNEQQVRTCQRLGYMNVFNPRRPAMHYRLRMFKADEHEVAWRLYNLSLDSAIHCWRNLTIDEVPKRINQGFNMWTVLRGNAADGTTPTTILEFDFVWPDEDAAKHLAARVIQHAWRAHRDPSLRALGVPAAGPRPASATQGPGGGGNGGGPRFVAFSAKKAKGQQISKMNDPASKLK